MACMCVCIYIYNIFKASGSRISSRYGPWEPKNPKLLGTWTLLGDGAVEGLAGSLQQKIQAKEAREAVLRMNRPQSAKHHRLESNATSGKFGFFAFSKGQTRLKTQRCAMHPKDLHQTSYTSHCLHLS